MQIGRLVMCWQRFSLASLSRQKEFCEAGMQAIFEKLTGLEKEEQTLLEQGMNATSISTKRRIACQLSVLRAQMLELHSELKLLRKSTFLAMRNIGTERRSQISKRFSLTSDKVRDADVEATLADENLDTLLEDEAGYGKTGEFVLSTDAILAELGVESESAETATVSSAPVGAQSTEPGGNGHVSQTDPITAARNATSASVVDGDGEFRAAVPAASST